jgi:hypothetical protein
MALRLGTWGRFFPFVFAAAVTAVFITPYCGFLFHCGCRQLWEGGVRYCNIYSMAGPHCPFCAHGSAVFYLLDAGSIMGAQFLALAFAARRGSVLFSCAIAVMVFLLAGGAAAWIAGSHDHYSRPSSAPLMITSCASADQGALPSPAAQHRFDHSILNGLLARYVDDHGWVDYAGLKNDRPLLDRYLESLDKADPGQFAGGCERLAFWINSYNAFTLADVLDDVYGKARGVREVPGFFNRKRHAIASQRLTLDEIEQQGRNIHDPRIHFALVCASTSCPRLQQFAYQGPQLEAELEQAAREFLGDPERGARIDSQGRLLLSPILKWYAGDFSGERGRVEGFFARMKASVSDQAALNYVVQYVPVEMKRWIDEKRPAVHYLEYDWSLNAQSTHSSRSGAIR